VLYDDGVPANANDAAGIVRDLQRRLVSSLEPPSTEELLASTRAILDSVDRMQDDQDVLAGLLDELERRMLAVENSYTLRLARLPGRIALDWRGRLARLVSSNAARPRALSPDEFSAYQRWVAAERQGIAGPEWFRARQREFTRPPIFSLVAAVDDVDASGLAPWLDAIRRQYYPHWELCVCASAKPSEVDQRIRFVETASQRSRSEQLNRAAALAQGDYLLWLDPEILLAEEALHYFAEALQIADADLVYADEDRINDSGVRSNPIFKPAWSPDLLLGCDYLGNSFLIKRSLFEELGGYRPEMSAVPAYDLALRAADRPLTVRHIPRVLSHRRAAEAGAVESRPALADTLARREIQATLEDGSHPGMQRIRRSVVRRNLLTIVICSRSEKLAARCLSALEAKTSYHPREVLLVQHGVDMRLDGLTCNKLRYDGPFNFSRMNNQAVSSATGTWLVFLNDDVTPLSSTWLDALAAHLERPEVGVAGALLRYPSGPIQHAGIATGMMQDTGHPHRDTFGSPFWPWVDCTRNVSAVTGACLGIRRELFERLGGFDEAFPVNFNDADLCLRAGAAGFRVLIEPAALLRHDECRTRQAGVSWKERLLWRRKWPGLRMGEDPFFSPHLRLDREDAGLRVDEPHTSPDNSR
jgi:hypothetical protein